MRALGTHAYRSNESPVPICRRVAGAVMLLAFMLVPGCLSPTPEKAVRGTTVPSPQLGVVILDLENRTGARESAHWRYASGLLRTSLKKVAALRLLPDEAVWRAWRRVGVPAGAPLDPNLLRRIGEEIEAQRVVWGSYSGNDRQWHVALRIVNVATGSVSAELAASGSDWYDLRDRLNEQILSELGVVPSAQEKERMAKRETRSPEALACCLQVHHLQQEVRPVSEMETLCRKAVAADPNFILARVFLASTLVNQGKFDLAEDLMQRTVQLDPDSASVHAALAWIFLAQQRWDQAEAEYRRVCRLNPGDAESLAWLAVCCDKKGKRDESLSLLEKAVALDRTAALAHAHLADAYAVRKRQEEALRELEEARFYLPEGIVAGNALLIMGNVYESLGRRPEAIECWERTLAVAQGMALDPDTNRFVERKIRRVKSAFRPTYVEAAMPKRYTPETLDRALRDTLSEAERRLVADPFSCTPPMKEWARELTRGPTTDLDKAKAIFYGLAARPTAPGRPQSRTARQVFEAWNQADVRLVCMDHAVLFVALARAVDVNAFFVNVTADPDGNVENHACAAVFTPGGTLLADSSLRWFGAPHCQYQILDDLQTTAFLCFNNTEANPQELATCRAGLKLWPDSVQGQLSLVGTLHHAHPEEARRVLAGIRAPRAGSYEAAIYWRLQGIFALDEHDWEKAEACMLKALSACPGDAGTHFGLGTLYLQQRRLVEARAAFRACLRDEPPAMVARAARHCIALINEEIGFDAARDMGD